jgi:uncharacterized membrane protein
MSDIVYTHESVVTKWPDVYNGCANITL